MSLGETIDLKIGNLCDESRISTEVEKIISSVGLKYRITVFTKELPLFLKSNWIPIEEQILKNGGKVEIMTYEPFQLPRHLKKTANLYFHNISDLIEVYKLSEPPKKEFATIYYSNLIVKTGNKFYLRKDSKTLVEKVLKTFDNFKNPAYSTKLDIETCFE